MSSTEETGSETEQRAAGAEAQPVAKPPRGPCCQVCGSGLSGRYETRFKVCRTHREADEVLHNGKVQRFCQQCNTFHVTERFEGGQRSCREQLARHAERRRELRRARREAEQGRSSPSSDGQHAASRRRAAGSPQRYNSAPAPLPPLLPGQPTAAAIPGGAQPDGSPPSKRQRAHSDALALLASMSVDALHAPPPPPPQQPQAQLQQSDTQSETLKLPILLHPAQPQAQPAAALRQGSPGEQALQPLALPLPPLLRSTLASTESATTSGAAAMAAAAGWDASQLPLHPLTRAAPLPGPPMPSGSGQPSDLAALAGALTAAASRQALSGGPPPALHPLQPAAPGQQQQQQPDMGLMLQQLLRQSSALGLPPQQALLLGPPGPGSQGIGQLSSQVDSALMQLRQQAAQQLLLLERKQRVLRKTMDALQQVMQPPVAAVQPLAAQPSGSLDALQLLTLLHQQQAQPSVAQQQGSVLLQLLGLGQPPP